MIVGFVKFKSQLTDEEIADILASRESLEPCAANVVDRGYDVKIDERLRKGRVWWITNNNPRTQWIMERLKLGIEYANQFFRADLSMMEAAQLTEYGPDDHFRCHIDSNYEDMPGESRKLSMTIQLSRSEDYEGGDLLLYPQTFRPWPVPRERGLAAVFPSYMIHEVTPVTKGKRYSIVAWTSGPPWR